MAQEDHIRSLYRDPNRAIIGGVCAGVAEVFDIDVVLARVTAVVAFVMTFGLAALLYLMLWTLLPVKAADIGIVEVEPRRVRSERYNKVVTGGNGRTRFERSASKVAEQERSRHASKPKKDLSPYRFALLLLFLSALLVTLVLLFIASAFPDIGFMAYAPLYFIPFGIFLIAMPRPAHSPAIRVCIMLLCFEACVTFFSFTLGLVDSESLSSLDPSVFVVWIIAFIFLVAALVFENAPCYLFAVGTVFIAMIVSSHDLGLLDSMLGLFSSGFPR